MVDPDSVRSVLYGLAVAAFLFAVAEYVGMYGLWLFPSRTGVRIYRGDLAGRFEPVLWARAARGFRVRVLDHETFLARPVQWYENEPSAAPHVLAMAKVKLVGDQAEITIFEPVGPLLFILVMTAIAVITVGWAVVLVAGPFALWVVRGGRSETTRAFRRLEHLVGAG